jgi:hypothetical protein
MNLNLLVNVPLELNNRILYIPSIKSKAVQAYMTNRNVKQ